MISSRTSNWSAAFTLVDLLVVIDGA